MAARTSSTRRASTFTGLPAMLGMVLRRLRHEAALLATVLAVVFVTSLVMTALPRLYNQMSDDGLVYDVENATTFTRNINVLTLNRFDAGPENTFGPLEQAGQEFLDDLPESMQDIVHDTNWAFDSPRYIVDDVPGTPAFPSSRFMRIRYQSDINEYIDLVSGSMPAPREPVPPPCVGDCPESDERWEIFEIAVSMETAQQINLQIGDQLILTPDRTDIQHRGRDLSALNYSVVIEVSGLFEPLEPDSPYWFEDRRLHRADEVDTGNFIDYYATSLMSPDDYQRLLDISQTATMSYNFRYYVDPQMFDVGRLPQLADDIRNAEFTFAGSAGAAPPGEFYLRTGLSGLFNRFLANQQQAVSVLSLAVIGLLAVTLAVLGLLAALIGDRRRAGVALQRGRGVSAGQLTASQASEGALLALPAALLGYVAALMLVEARASNWSLAAVAGLVGATALILVLTSLPYFRAPLIELEESTPVQRRASTRRIVVELTIVVLAVAGVVLLRRRGISPEGATGEGAGFDPYLAAVPILLGLATGLAALRLYPIPVRLLAWIGSLRRDLVMFIGLRRVAGQAASARLPLLVILLAVALAVFSTVVQRSIDAGQVETSWQNVGADYRVEPPTLGASLPGAVDLGGVEGVETIAPAFITTTNQLLSRDGRGEGSIRLMMIDTSAYQNVAADTPADPHFPEVMLAEQSVTDIGTPTNPIPAIISSAWPSSPAPSRGETFVLNMRGMEITFVAREVRQRFHGLPAAEPFIVASMESVADVNRHIQFRPNVLLIRGEPGIEDRLQATLRSQSRFARFYSRDTLYARVRDAPLTSGVSVGFRLSVVLATACASLAAVVALALTARARTRDLAYMRTLGLSTNQGLLLTMVEQLPPVLVAGVVGSLLGAGTARVIEPGVDLNAFTGPGLPASLLVDWWSVGTVVAILLGVVVLAITAFGLASRSVNLSQILRVGERE